MSDKNHAQTAVGVGEVDPGSAHLQRNSLTLTEVIMSGLAQIAPASSLMLTTALIAALAGASVPIVMLLTMVGVGATGNSLAQFSRIWPSSGSFATFISRTLGPFVGLAVAVMALLGYVVAFAGIYLFVGQFIGTELLGVHSTAGQTLVAIGYGLVVLIPVVVGLQVGIRLAIALYAFEVVVILTVSFAILAQGGDHGLSLAPFSLSGSNLTGIASACALGVLAYVGFEAPAPLAEESQNPRRNVPLAIMLGILVSGFLFVLGSYAVVEAFPSVADFAGDPAPYTTAASRFIPALANVVTALFITSVSASFIIANTQTARVIYNGAREGLWPSVLGRVHPRFKTPWLASIAFVAPALVLAVVGTMFWDIGTASGFMATAGTLGVVLMYALTNVGLVVLWFKERAAGTVHNPFLWLVTPVVGMVVMVLPFWANFQAGQADPYNKLPIAVAGLAVLGIAYAGLLRARRPELARNAGSLIMGEVAEPAMTHAVSDAPVRTTED